MSNIAIENGPVEIVSFPINSMVIFHSYVNVYQRVNKLTVCELEAMAPIEIDDLPIKNAW